MNTDEAEPDGFEAHTTARGLPCNSCKHLLPPLKDVAEVFFVSGSVECPTCSSAVDLWSAALAFSKEFGAALFTLPALGANLTLFKFELAVHESKSLDFADFGVPRDAVVLAVGYTPNGTGCFPVELHGNDARRRYLGTETRIYGVPFPPDKREPSPQEPIPIICGVCWIREADDTDPWLFLAQAFEAVADWRLTRMIVPAHAAFEVILSRLIRSFLSTLVSSKRKLDSFMVNDLSSSGALNVLLPMLCASVGIPPLREDIVNALNGLRTLRNRVVHEGLRDEDVEKAVAVRSLAAAVFGFEFVRLLRTKLVTDGNAV